MRGPGVPKGTVDSATSHTDLAPTFLAIAGAPNRDGLDGKTVLNLDGGNATQKTEHVAIEYWGLVSLIKLNIRYIPDKTRRCRKAFTDT